MKLVLVKPDLTYYEQYNEMMKEWIESNTQVAPWFLDKPMDNIESFIQMLDNCENINLDKKYCSTTSYFVIDENEKLIGAGSLRHYLTVEGYNSWGGHTGYGVRPSERRKGYGTQIEKLLLEEARNKHILKVLVGVHNSNIGSIKVIENCGGVLENIVKIPDDVEEIRRYWIDNK